MFVFSQETFPDETLRKAAELGFGGKRFLSSHHLKGLHEKEAEASEAENATEDS